MRRGVSALHNLGFKSAIVAGGAPRDLYHGKPIKDIDFFLQDPLVSTERINWTSLPNKEQTLKMSPPLFLPHMLGLDTNNCIIGTVVAQGFTWMLSKVDFKNDDEYAYAKPSEVTQIWNLYVENHTPLQFMFLKSDPVNFVEKKFDVGLCMCYFDGQKLRYTPEFIEDSSNQKFTICGDISDQQLHKTLTSHIPRLQTKYPWHTIEYAPHIQPKILQVLLTP